MKTSDFDFRVPKELIAHEPLPVRDSSRLMIVHRESGEIEHKHFSNLPEYLVPGDLLVMNNTKVLPANLVGRKEEGGAKIEILLLERVKEQSEEVWHCLVRPGKRVKVGSKIIFGEGELRGEVLEKLVDGEQTIRFSGELMKWVKRHGEMPLPPYVKPQDRAAAGRRYQTIYASREGAAAAPTAGFHFTEKLLKKIIGKGVKTTEITLHTGLATFKPIYAEEIEEHQMHEEQFIVPGESIKAIKSAKRRIAVGTTSVRTLETIAAVNPGLKSEKGLAGSTGLYIYPGYKFKIVDALVTNFHWPRTSLILLVSAFAEKNLIMRAYQEAIDKKYRFFSFGDAMLIV